VIWVPIVEQSISLSNPKPNTYQYYDEFGFSAVLLQKNDPENKPGQVEGEHFEEDPD